jgi:hypothetical protein
VACTPLCVAVVEVPAAFVFDLTVVSELPCAKAEVPKAITEIATNIDRFIRIALLRLGILIA